MSRRYSLSRCALAFAALAACDAKQREATRDGVLDVRPAPSAVAPDAASPQAASSQAASSRAASSDDAGARSSDALASACDAFAGAPRSGKSVGHTSVVFKLELEGGQKVAWKPNARRVKGRYKGEIAAYRLAQALGIDNVPPACPRAFAKDQVSAALASNPDAAKLLADEAIVEDGSIYGAIIPWIEGLSFWPVEKDPLRKEVRTWLSASGAIPEASADFARQASTLVAFDFLTGNWDRYSGENVGLSRDNKTVLYIDNDAAFMQEPPKDALARNRAMLEATDRYSKSVVARARALDEDRLAAVFGEEAPGRPLLAPKVVGLVNGRLKELLRVVDAKIAARGETETLRFP